MTSIMPPVADANHTAEGVMQTFLKCRIPCGHVHTRSWPLFRARDLMRRVIESFAPEKRQ